MRVVLDTTTLVCANPKVSPRGLARDLLLTIVSGPHVLILSSAILAEVLRVLTYPRVQARWPLTGEAIEHTLFFWKRLALWWSYRKFLRPLSVTRTMTRFYKPPLWAAPMFFALAMESFDTKLSSGSAPRPALIRRVSIGGYC